MVTCNICGYQNDDYRVYVREHRCKPEPTKDEILACLKEAYALMPLGASVRAKWMDRAGDIIERAERRR
jgi:hypothetical protein